MTVLTPALARRMLTVWALRRAMPRHTRFPETVLEVALRERVLPPRARPFATALPRRFYDASRERRL